MYVRDVRLSAGDGHLEISEMLHKLQMQQIWCLSPAKMRIGVQRPVIIPLP